MVPFAAGTVLLSRYAAAAGLLTPARLCQHLWRGCLGGEVLWLLGESSGKALGVSLLMRFLGWRFFGHLC
jgi:hypothetical protein